MTTVRVNLGPRSYDIAVVSGDGESVGPFIRERCHDKSALVAGNENTRFTAEKIGRAIAAVGCDVTMAAPGPAERRRPTRPPRCGGGSPSPSTRVGGEMHDMVSRTGNARREFHGHTLR
jgi:hypothetical protein